MHDNNYLLDILIILTGIVVIIPIFKRLKLGTVPGYLFAGILIGPFGIGFITQVEDIRHIAEFGVVFLLFLIGIELKPTRLWLMRGTVFGLGAAQVLLTGAVISLIIYSFNFGSSASIIVGFGLALSSTAFVLQILTEKKELETTYGNTSLSILLFQDLAVIPLLLLVSFLSATSTSFFQGAELKVLFALIGIGTLILFGKYVLNHLFHMVAASRSTEVFMAAALLLVLGISYLTEEFGLSMALGSFLAGLLLADSNYRHQVVADIQPFRGILLGLFFMSIGMSVDLSLFLQKWQLILLLVISLVLIKVVVLWLLCTVFNIQKSDRIQVSLLLSQSGEFGFVIFALALSTGIIQDNVYQILVMLIALTMMLTPFMAHLSRRIKNMITTEGTFDELPQLKAGQDRVIIAGLGRVGRRVVKTLNLASISYTALDNNPSKVLRAKKLGFNVFYGDALRADVLETLGINDTSILVITFKQEKEVERLVRIVLEHFPDTRIFVRARDRGECERLLGAGANLAISEVLEAGLELGGAVLKSRGMDDDEIQDLLQDVRQDYYVQVSDQDT